MPERMKPHTLSLGLAFLIVYLGVQALTGERGLLSGAEREALLVRREAQLAGLVDERRELEVRARYLRTDHLSRDLLEERARAVLGFADPRDVLISVGHAAPASPPAPSVS